MTRKITASLAAFLGAAALAAPAVAANDSAKANVYVPPASLAAGDPAKADVYVPPASLAAGDPAKADVYVPPASVAAGDPAKADVYVPPASVAAGDPAKADVYVPPASLASGTAAPATVPTNPEPHGVAAASQPSSDFDWGSAGMGAAAGIAALLLACGGVLGLRRRRQAGSAVSA
jgi:hypothetical protein